MAICIREAKERDGRSVKWKTYGSKRFIPYKIFDEENPAIFVGYGIGEFLLFELLELNYMVLQSDSIAKTFLAIRMYRIFKADISLHCWTMIRAVKPRWSPYRVILEAARSMGSTLSIF